MLFMVQLIRNTFTQRDVEILALPRDGTEHGGSSLSQHPRIQTLKTPPNRTTLSQWSCSSPKHNLTFLHCMKYKSQFQIEITNSTKVRMELSDRHWVGGNNFHVACSSHRFFSAENNGKIGFHVGFVETRKCSAGIWSFHLSYSQPPVL